MHTVKDIKARLLIYNVWRAKIDVVSTGVVDIYVPKRKIRFVQEIVDDFGYPAIQYRVKQLHNVLKFKKYHYAFERN